MVEILGILNLTRDSFSDGGRYVALDAALAHARRMAADGAAVLDLGAESSHPDAAEVSAEEEIARLTPVMEQLRADGLRVSVDTYKPAVLRHVVQRGAEFINDITGLGVLLDGVAARQPEALEALAVLRDSPVRIILMHALHSKGRARAERMDADAGAIVPRIRAFFERRLAALAALGIAGERCILDPGMGFFLGRAPEPSLEVLRDLERFAALNLPLCLSTSRKSFIGAVLERNGQPCPVAERGAGTLATEIWAYQQGVRYIRTHDVRALRDAVRMWEAIAGPAKLRPSRLRT